MAEDLETVGFELEIAGRAEPKIFTRPEAVNIFHGEIIIQYVGIRRSAVVEVRVAPVDISY